MSDIYGASCRFIKNYPPEYLAELKRRTVESAWLDVLNKIVLTNQDKFLVVKMYDTEEQTGFDETTYQIRFMFSFAQEQTVHLATYEELPTAIVSRSAVDEIKYRIRAKIKRLFKR